MLSKMKSHKEEDGFTLIELMVVVVIIGILAAIAIPIFANQQKEASDATLKSDLKNAGLAMTTSKTSNGGDFAPYLPGYSTLSDKNQVVLDTSNSNKQAFCLVGVNTTTDTTMYYSSSTGKISEKEADCSSTLVDSTGAKGKSFQQEAGESLASEKALIIRPAGKPQDSKNVMLQNYGFGTVDTVEHGSHIDAAYIEPYSLIIVDYTWWVAPTYSWAIPAVEQGKSVLISGNDTYTGHYFITESFATAAPGGYTPTYAQGLNPPFPYLFSKLAWTTNDTFRCNTAVDAVPLATATVGSDTCITMFAKPIGSGKFLFMSLASNDAVFKSAVNWLTS